MCKQASKQTIKATLCCFLVILFYFENIVERYAGVIDRCSCLVARAGPRGAGQILWVGATRAPAAHAALSGLVVASQRDPRQEEEAQTRPPRRRYPPQIIIIIIINMLLLHYFLFWFIIFFTFTFFWLVTCEPFTSRIHFYYFFTFTTFGLVVGEEGHESGFERTLLGSLTNKTFNQSTSALASHN